MKEINSLLETVSEGGRGAGTGGGGTYKVTAKGPAKIITRVKGVRPALQSVLKMAGSAISSGQGSSKIRPRTKTDDKDSAKQAKTQISFEEHPSRQSTQRQSTGQTSGGFEGRPSRQSTQGQSTGQTSGESRQEKQPLDQSQEQPQKRGQFMEQKDSGQPVSQSLSQKQPENLQQEQLQFQREPIPQASIIEGDNKHLRMNFDVPLNSDDLRIQLEVVSSITIIY